MPLLGISTMIRNLQETPFIFNDFWNYEKIFSSFVDTLKRLGRKIGSQLRGIAEIR